MGNWVFSFLFFRILSLTKPSAYPTTQQCSTRAPFQERVVVLARVALDRWLVGHFGEEVLIELDFEDFEVLHRGYIGWDEVPQLGTSTAKDVSYIVWCFALPDFESFGSFAVIPLRLEL